MVVDQNADCYIVGEVAARVKERNAQLFSAVQGKLDHVDLP